MALRHKTFKIQRTLNWRTQCANDSGDEWWYSQYNYGWIMTLFPPTLIANDVVVGNDNQVGKVQWNPLIPRILHARHVQVRINWNQFHRIREVSSEWWIAQVREVQTNEWKMKSSTNNQNRVDLADNRPCFARWSSHLVGCYRSVVMETQSDLFNTRVIGLPIGKREETLCSKQLSR